jgi:hypothetical protein
MFGNHISIIQINSTTGFATVSAKQAAHNAYRSATTTINANTAAVGCCGVVAYFTIFYQDLSGDIGPKQNSAAGVSGSAAFGLCIALHNTAPHG